MATCKHCHGEGKVRKVIGVTKNDRRVQVVACVCVLKAQRTEARQKLIDAGTKKAKPPPRDYLAPIALKVNMGDGRGVRIRVEAAEIEEFEEYGYQREQRQGRNRKLSKRARAVKARREGNKQSYKKGESHERSRD